MTNPRSWFLSVLSAGLILSCGADPGGAGSVGTVTEAISPCNETVPANRFIDGLPAYAQCATTMDGAIYSNNGVDTSTTSMGADWVRTQYSGGYQCTELAHRYLLFKWKVDWLPRGNAGEWCDTQPTATSGVTQTTTPVHGDLMVFAPGSCGADSVAGHVAVVDTVGAKVSAVQQNVASRGSYMASCAKCYLHVVANSGTPGSGGAGGGTGAGGSPGAGGAPASGTGGTVATGGTAPVGTGGVTSSAGGFVSSAGGPSVSGSTGAGGTPTTPPSSNGGAIMTSGAGGGVTPSSPGTGGATGYGGQAGSAVVNGGDPTADSGGGTSCTVSGAASKRAPGHSGLAALFLAALVLGRRRSRR